MASGRSAARSALLFSVLGAAVALGVAGAPTSLSSAAQPPAKPFLAASASGGAVTSTTPAAGFQDTVAFSGLTNPTAVRFSPDGRVFVIEKRGLLKVFDSVSDPTPSVVTDLRGEVDDFWDRGLLGLALDPDFPASPYLYLLYTYDAPPGGTAPVWNDGCPSPPGPTSDGCVVTGKLVRITLAGDSQVGSPRKLIANEWCQQFPSHSIGDLAFGPDGKLYVSGGDGASFTFADYGQAGGSSPTPKNPCGDPPAGVGGTETPPSAEGGALRAQSPNRAAGPTILDGTLLRLDPATGAAAAGNPNAGAADLNLRRVVAYGFRNPFRFAFRPGTSELWLGDVGWDTWEEINRIDTPPATARNFGWPCYEGSAPQPAYRSAGLAICSNLYGAGTAAAPYYAYSHGDDVALNDGCPTNHGSVISGIAFYDGNAYPAAYDGALVFADHSRECIWAMPLGANGQPDPTRVRPLVSEAANPVDVEPGPNGDLYYVDFDGGTIHHLSYAPPGTCVEDTFLASYYNSIDLSGSPALTACEDTVSHDWGTGSPGTGVNSNNFSVRWSGQFHFAGGDYEFTSTADDGVRVYVDGSLAIDDWQDQSATTEQATVPVSAGLHSVVVEYYDHTGSALAQVGWRPVVSNRAPTAVIDTPSPALTYAVGDPISFSGHATDPEQGTLPASALTWTLLIHHCTTPATCHVHIVQSWDGVSGETLNAPDHDYPSQLELVLHATDAGGLVSTTSVTLDPRTVHLTFRTSPERLSLAVGSSIETAPFTRTVIVGSANSVSAPATQALAGTPYDFSSWSDGGAATHNLTAPASDASYTANYAAPPPLAVLPPFSMVPPTLSGTAREGSVLTADKGEWSGSQPLSYSVDWLRCGKDASACAVVEGAYGTTYVLSAVDVGSRIIARVTADNAVGSSMAQTSPTGVVAKHPRGPIKAVRRVPAPRRPRVLHKRPKRLR